VDFTTNGKPRTTSPGGKPTDDDASNMISMEKRRPPSNKGSSVLSRGKRHPPWNVRSTGVYNMATFRDGYLSSIKGNEASNGERHPASNEGNDVTEVLITPVTG